MRLLRAGLVWGVLYPLTVLIMVPLGVGMGLLVGLASSRPPRTVLPQRPRPRVVVAPTPMSMEQLAALQRVVNVRRALKHAPTVGVH